MKTHLKNINDFYDNRQFFEIVNYPEISSIKETLECAVDLSFKLEEELIPAFNSYYRIALSFYKLNKFNEAIEAFKFILKSINKIDDKHKLLIGKKLSTLVIIQNQLKETQRGIDKLNLKNKALITLGFIYFKRENFTKAIQIYWKLHKSDPNNTLYRVYLIENYYKWKNQFIEFSIKTLKFFLSLLSVILLYFYFKNQYVLLILCTLFLGLCAKYIFKILKSAIYLCFLPFKPLITIFKKIDRKIYPFRSVYNNFCEKTISLIEKQSKNKEENYKNFRDLCKIYYFQKQYYKSHHYAELALANTKKEKQIYIYDWLSRIAYKTKNHATAADFYKEIIFILTDKSENIDSGENDPTVKEIEPIPDLHDMVKYLQQNRDILNGRAADRVFIPVVITLIVTCALTATNLYYSHNGKSYKQDTKDVSKYACNKYNKLKLKEKTNRLIRFISFFSKKEKENLVKDKTKKKYNKLLSKKETPESL